MVSEVVAILTERPEAGSQGRRRRHRPGACAFAAQGQRASLTGCRPLRSGRSHGRLGGAAGERRTIHQSAAARLLYQAPPARAVIAAEYPRSLEDSWGCRRCRHRRARATGGAGAGDTAAEQSSAHLIGNGDGGVTLVPGGCKPLCTHTTPGQRDSQPASQLRSLLRRVSAGKRVARTKAALRAGEHLRRNGRRGARAALPSPLPFATALEPWHTG